MASADLKLTNQLSYVTDTKASGNHADDIDNQSNSFNYQYDEIGNLTKDISEEIEKIEWTVYGKIRRITRTATSTKPDLEFEYTPDGHRAVKIIIPKNSTMRTYTYYIRDAQGNIMATYSRQFQKTIDYANLSYTQVNTKLTEKTSPESFAWFVANAHASGATGLKNALKNDILSGTAATDWFLNHPSLNPELILNQESDLADRVWSNYNKVEVLKIIQGSGSLNLKQICICMKSRRGDPNSPNYKTFMEHVLSKSKLRSLFLAYLSANKPGLYSDFFSKLGIATVDLQTDLDNLITRINTNGVAAVGNDLLAANQYVDCDDYIISYQDYLNNYWDEQTEEELSQIEDFNEIFQNTNEDNFNFSCEELGLSYLFSLLNSQNTTTLRSTMIAQVQGTGISTEQQKKNWLINWYFENDPMGSIYLATLRNPALVASYQTSPGMLYGTPFATGMENYFQKIKTHFGQSMFDQLLTEFAQQSNLYVDEIKVDEWHIYGSSRLGVYEANRTISKRVARDLNNDNQITNNEYVIETPEEVMYLYNSYQLERGAKRYELANHLGNVLTVISDKKTANFTGSTFTNFTAERISATDYSPFGAPLAGRTWNGGEYRFGFNGKENDNEIKGNGNQQDYGMRIHDTRLGRFLSVDPLQIEYPFYSTYHFAGNSPIDNIDLDGFEPLRNGYRTENMRKGIVEVKITNNAKVWKTSPFQAPKSNFQNNKRTVSNQNHTEKPTKRITNKNNGVVNDKPVAFVESTSVGFAFVGGFGLEYGSIKMADGSDEKSFFSVCGNIGYGMGVSENIKEVYEKEGKSFKLSDYEGSGFSFNFAGGFIGGSAGGNLTTDKPILPQIVNGGFSYYETSANLDPTKRTKPKKAGLGGMFSISKTIFTKGEKGEKN